MILKFRIDGVPIAKQSFRKTRSGHCYQKKEIIDREKEIKRQVLKQLPEGFEPSTSGIIINYLTFVFPPTKSIMKGKNKNTDLSGILFKNTKPDLDNLEKLLFDALQGVVYVNDSQIYKKKYISKIYGLTPGIELEIEVLEFC